MTKISFNHQPGCPRDERSQARTRGGDSMRTRYFCWVITVLALASCASPQERFLKASVSGNEEGIRTAIQNGGNANASEMYPYDGRGDCGGQRTALQFSVCKGNVGIVKALLANGADPNLAPSARTPLIEASRGNNREMVKMLLDAGARADQTSSGETALTSTTDVEIVRMLLSQKASLDLAGKSGMPPLAQAADAGIASIVGLLLSSGASVNKAGPGGQTALMLAANEETAKLLFAAKADLRARDNDGNDALLHAVMRSRADVARFLIQNGADIFSKNNAGTTVVALGLRESGDTGNVIRKAYEPIARRELESNLRKGDQAAAAGNFSVALTAYSTALSRAEDLAADLARSIRIRVLKTVSAWAPQPPIPDKAREHVLRADAYIKRGRSGSEVESELQQAIALAPWWADGYFNLGLVQGSGNRFAEAIASLNLFIEGAPNNPRVQAARDKLVEFKIGQEEVEKIAALSGSWFSTNGNFFVSVSGDKLSATSADGKFSINTTIRERALSGTIDGKPYVGEYQCTIPAQSHSIVGKINPDGRSIELEYSWSSYAARQRCTGILGDAIPCQPYGLVNRYCDGVSISGTSNVNLRLYR